jgi:hypothetical protein
MSDDTAKYAIVLRRAAELLLAGTGMNATVIVHAADYHGAVATTLPTEQLLRACLADVVGDSLMAELNGNPDAAGAQAQADLALLKAARASAP